MSVQAETQAAVETADVATPAATAGSEPQASVQPSVEAPLEAEAVTADHAPALNAEVCAPDGVAVGGYDLVSYFGEQGPQIGAVDIQSEYQGLVYRFASEDNRETFALEPERYVPSYRGWCSTNLSMGRLACPDYTNYKIENGRLLFFEQVGFTNGLDVWNSNPLLHKRQADRNFRLLSNKPSVSLTLP